MKKQILVKEFITNNQTRNKDQISRYRHHYHCYSRPRCLMSYHLLAPLHHRTELEN